MSFYNRKIATNKALVKAWKAGHYRKMDEVENICVPEICDEIALWMRRDRRPRSRLSLRSFSILLSGTVRLYRNQVNHLLRDTFNYSLFKKPTIPSPALTSVDQDTPVSAKALVLENSNGTQSVNNSNNTKSSEENLDDDMSEESTVFTVTPYEQQANVQEIREKSGEKRDQIVQTSPTPEVENNVENFSGFNPNLPFGYIIVHDNYHSSIPSKILFSSLNENINLYPFSSQ